MAKAKQKKIVKKKPVEETRQSILARIGEIALENEQIQSIFQRNSQIVEALKQQLLKEGKKNERP